MGKEKQQEDLFRSIKSEKIRLRSEFEKGTNCACCGQFVKQYKRKFNTVMARSLISLNNLGTGFHHVRNIMKGISDTGTNDFSKLRYYGFIQEKNNSDESKKTSGFWKITKSGLDFINNKTKIPSHVFIYNTKIQGFSKTTLDIKEALGNKFNYQELMQ